jgi:hypothetical protein
MRISYKGINVEQFLLITTNVCGLPKFLNSRLFSKLSRNHLVTYDSFTEFWKSNILGKDENTRLFNSIKSNDSNFIIPQDFQLIMAGKENKKLKKRNFEFSSRIEFSEGRIFQENVFRDCYCENLLHSQSKQK